MFYALNDIVFAMVNDTQATINTSKHFLNYVVFNPNAEIKFGARDMILKIKYDGTYLVALKLLSYTDSYNYLGNIDNTFYNGPILSIAKIIK